MTGGTGIVEVKMYPLCCWAATASNTVFVVKNVSAISGVSGRKFRKFSLDFEHVLVVEKVSVFAAGVCTMTCVIPFEVDVNVVADPGIVTVERPLVVCTTTRVKIPVDVPDVVAKVEV